MRKKWMSQKRHREMGAGCIQKVISDIPEHIGYMIDNRKEKKHTYQIKKKQNKNKQ